MAPDQKQRMRMEFEEEGTPLSALAATHLISPSTLYSRARREGWGHYGNRAPGPVSLTHLERNLRKILKIMLTRLDAELGEGTDDVPVPAAAQSRLDTAFKTYLKILDIQAKIQSAKPKSQHGSGTSQSATAGPPVNRDAVVQSLLRRLDVLRASGETEIGARLAERT